MKRELSIYLDAVRFFAALMVFIDHSCGQRISGGLFWQLGMLGPEAVTVFFVLSGFVIAHTTTTSETRASAYAMARISRIYSVALPTLLLTFTFDTIGQSFGFELYSNDYRFPTGSILWQYLSAGLFLNQLWGFDVAPGSNWSYWSLGCEVWYYIIFGLGSFAPKGWRVPLILLTLVLVGPTIAFLFPLWLMGVGLYRIVRADRVGPRGGAALFAASALVWGGYEIWAFRHGRLAYFSEYVLFRRNELPQDLLVALLFSANLIGFNAMSPALAGVCRVMARPVRWLAGATFTLYLLHEPALRMLAQAVPWPPSSWPSRIVVLGGTLLMVFAVAQVTERRKHAWRRLVEALYRRTNRLAPARQV